METDVPVSPIYQNCEQAKPERVAFYPTVFQTGTDGQQAKKFVNVEGPEFTQDYSYFLCDMKKEIGQIE